MKRPTRVPASSVVRMNSASNMIAKWYQSAIAPLPPSTFEKRCAMPTARLGAPPVRDSSEVSPTCCASSSQLGRRRATKPQFAIAAAARLRRRADAPRRRVDREVDARREHAGGDQRHDRDERLHQHRAVADHARVGLALEQLRRRARRDQRVEAGDRAARDRDEREREQLAGEHRPRAVDELRQRRHLQRRQHDRGCRAPARARRRSSRTPRGSRAARAAATPAAPTRRSRSHDRAARASSRSA